MNPVTQVNNFVGKNVTIQLLNDGSNNLWQMDMPVSVTVVEVLAQGILVVQGEHSEMSTFYPWSSIQLIRYVHPLIADNDTTAEVQVGADIVT